MNQKPGKPAQEQQSAADRRKAKLAAELRANLQKRKAQARARQAGEAQSDPGTHKDPPPKRP